MLTLERLRRIEARGAALQAENDLREALTRQLHEAAVGLRDQGVSLREIWRQLQELQANSHTFSIARSQVAQEIIGWMVQRNNRGIACERSGQLDEAIALYEQSVADDFPGTHPYERLRILYTRQRRYHDAIRVCECYLAIIATYGKPNGLPKTEQHIKTLREKASRG